LRSNDRYVSIKFPQNLVSTHAPTSETKFWPSRGGHRAKWKCSALTLTLASTLRTANKQQTNNALRVDFVTIK
jgi:hypothetical protein